MKEQPSNEHLAYPISSGMKNCSDKLFIPSLYNMHEMACAALIKEAPLCHLTSLNSNGGLSATSIPLVLDEHEKPGESLMLLGHIAKRNPHTADLKNGMPVLGVFSGPNSYISPRWFKERLTVPTWSFSSVHVHGTLEIVNEPSQIRTILESTIEQLEFTVDGQQDDSSAHWSLKDADNELVNRLLTGIVGLKININSMEGIARTVQEKSDIDRESIADGLCSSLNWQARRVGLKIKEILKQATG
ncbi:FMN-binding negative transcriptional regulator [Alteromonas sp. C1M14]|uniref:FMN-binding negative transcriptional regulator n=1 Tax=Alteromonas sp. C1M14 TaxID=2841567 RepID=UPI001C081703|nr:FMN-binding negative transcriptional regulator [Alteromonas sp. C1M14]MBU2978241.1 FMN-binding negative transcriptional regulator [Alteromonas sp. C1M14]